MDIDEIYVPTMTVEAMNYVEGAAFLEPAVKSVGLDPNGGLVVAALEGAATVARGPSEVSRFFSEASLHRAIEALAALSGELDEIDLEPRPAPIHAEVVEGTLRLVDPAETIGDERARPLEELRREFREEVTRLRQHLRGSNAGEGFLWRLERLEFRLDQPLSDANALVIATQVRALEDMIPAINEVLTDATASDLGATLAGLSLLVRQFPSWREFLATASQEPNLNDEILGDVVAVLDHIQNQPTAIVEQELVTALADLRSAADGSLNGTLAVGLVHSANNIAKAVARSVRSTFRSIIEKYGDDLKSRVATVLTDFTMLGVIVALSEPLLRLGAALPSQFGWIFAIMLWIGAKGLLGSK